MNMTTGIRERVRNWMPLEDLLPDHLPVFVRSPAYFFGVISLSSLVLLFSPGSSWPPLGRSGGMTIPSAIL